MNRLWCAVAQFAARRACGSRSISVGLIDHTPVVCSFAGRRLLCVVPLTTDEARGYGRALMLVADMAERGEVHCTCTRKDRQ